MKIPFLLKSVLVGLPIGVTFTDCVGYVARVEGKWCKFNSIVMNQENCWYCAIIYLFTGVSMQPTLNPDVNSEDYVFLSRWAVKDLYFERGDIISMISPKDQNQRIIKRIVGLQGWCFRQWFRIQWTEFDWIVYFAGDIVSTIGYKKPYIKVPDGHCWVEGDHTGFSLDSNSFGPVSLGLITARATYIVWPPSRWQCLQGQTVKQRNPISTSSSRISTEEKSIFGKWFVSVT